jgi:hypothetical protein
MDNTGEDVQFGARGAVGDAEGVGATVKGADPLAGRVAVENDDGRVFELGAEAEHGLRGKFADIEAGVEATHLRPDFSE